MDKNQELKTKLQIAKEFGIPLEQVETISLPKYMKYKEYLSSDAAKVERFLDQLDEQRLDREAREAQKLEKKGFRKWARSVISA